MSTQLLIYETAVPVSSARHGKCSVEVTDYNFSRNVNAVPLVAAEFPEAEADYAIVFAGEGESLMPVVILGAREKENLYLTADGGWQVRYIPAFVRRYPFVFSNSKESNTYTLCVDEAFQGLNYRGRGKPLFTEEGKPTPFVESVLNFLQEYTAQATRTQAFCRKLAELKLLQPMQAEFTLTTGEKTALKGFLAVDRKKLRGLSGEALADMAKTDELELLYLHLYSMRNFMTVKDRLVQTQGSKIASGTEVPTEEAVLS
jgi:SapC